MSEKIRALRKTLESTTGKGQAQAAQQQAYGTALLYQSSAIEMTGLTQHRSIARKEQEDRSSNHHDLIFANRSNHNVERQEVPRTGHVSASPTVTRM